MERFSRIPSELLLEKKPWYLLAFALLVGSVLAALSQDYVLLIGVLSVGLPFAGLVVSRRTRATAVILLLIFVPLTSILKAVTGSRFAPLTFDLALLLAFVLYIGEGLVRNRIRLGWLDLFFALFLLWASLQMFNPNVPSLQAGAEGLRKFAYASILFYMGRHFFRLKDVVLFQKLLIIASVAISLYGLKQFFFMSAVDYRMIALASASPTTYLMGGWIRPFSTLPGPFHLGIYLVVVTLLLLARLMMKYGRFSTRLLVPFILLLHGVVLLFTRTKGNWVGLAAGVVMLMVLQTRRPLKLFFQLIGLALAVVIIVSVVLALASSNSQKVLNDAIVAITNPLEAPTFVYRVQLWNEVMIPALRENPLWGYGTSSAGEGLSNLYEGTGSKHFPSHNLYLKVFLELGLVGVFLFLTLVVGSLLKSWRFVRRSHLSSPDIVLTQHWAIATIVAFLVAGLVIPTLDVYPVNYYFWLFLGLISSREFTQTQPVVVRLPQQPDLGSPTTG